MSFPNSYKKYLFIFVAIILCLYTASKKFIIPVNPYPDPKPTLNPLTTTYALTIAAKTYQFEKRISASEQELGLSYRERLSPNTGMAFLYPYPQKVVYWMRGMLFPLDFIWVANGKVVDLSRNVAAPDKAHPAPKIVSPITQVDLVLEVPIGFIDANKINIGDSVNWQP